MKLETIIAYIQLAAWILIALYFLIEIITKCIKYKTQKEMLANYILNNLISKDGYDYIIFANKEKANTGAKGE